MFGPPNKPSGERCRRNGSVNGVNSKAALKQGNDVIVSSAKVGRHGAVALLTVCLFSEQK